MVGDWINGINVIPNERIRENMYNIEQFKFDGLQQEQTPEKG